MNYPIPDIKITAEWLQARGACASEVNLFRETFPRGGARLNRRNLIRAARAELLIAWLFRRLLSAPAYRRAMDYIATDKYADQAYGTEGEGIGQTREYLTDVAVLLHAGCKYGWRHGL